MKTTFTLFVLCLCSCITAAQTSVGAGVFGGSPRNNGAFVQSVYAQLDLLQPEETILHFGVGAQYAIEYGQATHATPYGYAAVQLRDIYLGIRAGGSYTTHIDERLKESMGKSRWFSYTAIQIDWVNDKPIGAFMTVNYSRKNSLSAVLGIRYNF